MQAFAARMREARVNKQERRNRGATCGNHRGGLRPRTTADVYRGYDAMELGIAALVQSTMRDPLHGFSEDLDAIVRELNDPTIDEEIPF